MVSPKGEPQLMDFGISHLMFATSTVEPATRADKGSVRWMAIELFDFDVPEESALGQREHTTMSDVWAFGMTVLVVPLIHLSLRTAFEHAKFNRSS